DDDGDSGSTTIDVSRDFQAPRVATTSVTASGVLAPHATSLDVQFDRDVLGADNPGNFQLQGVGADGLLGTADDGIVSRQSASYDNGTRTAHLAFADLPQSIYRLFVSDAIASIAGVALDGDSNGHSGGAYRIDFLSSPAESVPLVGPNGHVFDPQIGGFGA